MVKIKIGKWGNLKDLSISISPMRIGIAILSTGALVNFKDLLSFLKLFFNSFN